MATAKKQQASFIAIMSGLHIHSYCKILKLFLVVIGIERLGFNRPSKWRDQENCWNNYFYDLKLLVKYHNIA